MSMFMFFVNAACCAVNAAFFVALHDPLNLGAAILSGFVALAVLATAV